MNAEGTCDILVAVEPRETLRSIQYLNYNSIVILNTNKIIPATVAIGRSGYPAIEQIKAILEAVAGKVIAINALELAKTAGVNIQAFQIGLEATRKALL